MPTPIAKLYSTIDSMKRVLADRLAAGPVEDLKKTLSRAGEDAAKFRETQKRGGPAATEAMLETVLNLMPGGGAAGMIVPAERMLDFATFNGVRKSLKAGADPEYVYRNSGVYNAPQDDVLRTVISDLRSTLKTTDLMPRTGPAPKTVADLLDHPELFKYYPELATIKVKPSLGYGDAAYTPGNLDLGDLGTIRLGTFSSPEELHKALLHELQHGTQNLGGMTPGGNPGMFISDPVRLKKAKAAAEAIYRPLDTAFETALEKAGVDFGSAASKKLPEYAPRKAALKNDLALYRASVTDPMDKYLALPGEIEARTVESMFANKLGDEVFPPRFQRTSKDLSREDLSTSYYVDLDPLIADLINKLVPRP